MDCALGSLDGWRILRTEIISGGDNAPTELIAFHKFCRNNSGLPAGEGASTGDDLKLE
ncbi:MAG: hypothetical protein PHQ86_02450 [Dehalococcoidales bacterium]|nr:hypothetical protein [Dehalococcoidales bacterium]